MQTHERDTVRYKAAWSLPRSTPNAVGKHNSNSHSIANDWRVAAEREEGGGLVHFVA